MRQPERRAKIICTLGPAVSSPDAIEKLITQGMDVARLNFSHGNHDQHRQNIQWIRQASARLHIPVAILADIQGPKIRTGKLLAKGPLPLQAGQELHFAALEPGQDSTPGDGSAAKPISISYARLGQDLRPGDRLLFDDGLVRMHLTHNDPNANRVVAVVEHGRALGENKGVNMPGARLSGLGVTEKDWADILFCVEADVDFIALSFVRTAREVKSLKVFLEQRQSGIKLVSKIEMSEALENIDAIIEQSDGIMVARGDLGVEIGNENVPLVQKQLVTKARGAGKPVIIATQMLMSMVENPTPSRAEASDVANGVFDGADALMLSNETASGQYPFEAVQTMDAIIKGAESLEAREFSARRFTERRWNGKPVKRSEAVGRSATLMCELLGARCIICMSYSGEAARVLARQRPSVPIFAFTDSEKVRNQLCLSWGVYVVTWNEMKLHYPHSADPKSHLVVNSLLGTLGKLGLLKEGDQAVMTSSHPTSLKPGSTNAIIVKSYPPEE